MNSQQRILSDFAVKLTLAPAQMDQGDIARLRQEGLTDTQITIATQVVGYFNYINRIADGLGVELEDWMTTVSREHWERSRGQGYLETIYTGRDA